MLPDLLYISLDLKCRDIPLSAVSFELELRLFELAGLRLIVVMEQPPLLLRLSAGLGRYRFHLVLSTPT